VIGGQAAWSTAIGGVVTHVYFPLYLGLRNVLGSQPTNYLAWAVNAVAGIAANRRLTFAASDRVFAGDRRLTAV
jgi:hypothetical protein